MKLTPWNIISTQLSPTPEVRADDLSGKTVIVVGANSGIGYETAKHLALMNPGKLILGCRDKSRGDEAIQRLLRETRFQNAEMWLLDLSSFESVNGFVERVEQECPRVDLLVESAALLPTETLDGTQDGWETVFQVNNLSTSLLALLLLPRMIETAKGHNTKPRIVVVSSEVHYFAKLKDSVLNSDQPLHAFGKLENCDEGDITNRYYDTKLFNVFFVRSLSERLASQPIIVNTVNPGYCLSNLRKGLKGFRAAVDWVMEKLIARTSEEGARQVVWAAIGSKGTDDMLRGAYISQMSVSEPSDFVISRQGMSFQEDIWNDMIRELSAVNPKLESIVSDFLTPTPPVEGSGPQSPADTAPPPPMNEEIKEPQPEPMPADEAARDILPSPPNVEDSREGKNEAATQEEVDGDDGEGRVKTAPEAEEGNTEQSQENKDTVDVQGADDTDKDVLKPGDA